MHVPSFFAYLSFLVLCGSRILVGFSDSKPEYMRGQKQSGVKFVDNGALQLIIEAFVENLLWDLQKANSFQSLPHRLIGTMRERLKGLSHHIRHHPALREKRLWIGKKEPLFEPERSQLDFFAADDENSVEPLMKRERRVFLAEEICRTTRKWEQLNKTTDIFGRDVQVAQRPDYHQYVFVYRCVVPKGACIGISPLYSSECEMRYSWMLLLHRDAADNESLEKWGYVAVPHHCACKITPKYITENSDRSKRTIS